MNTKIEKAIKVTPSCEALILNPDKKAKRLPDRTVYSSTAPLLLVKAQSPDGELTTTYEYNNDAVVLDEYQKFARKLRRRSWSQLLVKRKRLAAEHRKFCKLLAATTLSQRMALLQIHIKVVEQLQNLVADEIARRGDAGKGIRQGCS